MDRLIKIISSLFNTRSAGIYTLLFAASIAIATFIENDFGTSAAQKIIFKAHWFELLLTLFGISILVNIYKFKMIALKKYSLLCFHLSILVILIGAMVTRYFSFEGMMHIREGESASSFITSDTYLQIRAKIADKEYQFDDKVLFASLGNNNYERSLIIGPHQVDIAVIDFIPNPKESLVVDEQGEACLKIVVGGEMGREEYILKQQNKLSLTNLTINFGLPEDDSDVHIIYSNDSLLIKSKHELSGLTMATQQSDSIAAGTIHALKLRTLYSSRSFNFVIADFKPNARVSLESSERKMSSTSLAALQLKVRVDGDEQIFPITGGPGELGNPRNRVIGKLPLSFSYGAKMMELPFSIKLNDFIMDRYPGTNSASSYASEVTLLDKRSNRNENIRIYMNHILDHDGYRFFQSSFDKDELGTYLSVNHDFWGTWISYIGYILLTLGLLATLFSKNTRFHWLKETIQNLRIANRNFLIIGSMILLQVEGRAQSTTALPKIDAAHARYFGELIVQDQNGRMKPMNTLAREVIRKLSRKDDLFGMDANQAFISMACYPEIWQRMQIIKLGKHEKITQLFNSQGLISYEDLFNNDGAYKIKSEVRNAYNLKPVDRGIFEKEIIKLDERVNIVNMVFTGSFLRLFPVKNDKNNHWAAPAAGHNHMEEAEEDHFPQKFFDTYTASVKEAALTNDWSNLNSLLSELKAYQKKVGAAVYPSVAQIQAEIVLNKIDIFNRLGTYYGLLGLFFLTLLFISIFNSQIKLKRIFNGGLIVLFICFFLQTTGLLLRWYVSGRAPWSNGYESMIYIGWTTMLAGLLFARKTVGGLAACCILASVVLMVAHLSWLDPEITPLVPVLKSYWLTIHVSLEAGSYGFLVLGAIIGALNLILMIFATKRNQQRIERIILELSYTSEMTIIGGLIMLSVGTYLGGVWANESWGRYWGWDAKETWALVSILVYSFILHMRLIPGLQSKYAFNTATLFGFASVLMTYLGVNYYLSGLHSYAAGDPVPIPTFVYYTVSILILISLIAYFRNKNLLKL
ncbi:MAG: cytochrome c biogenesis protein CcsA [Saprospiraceae bacterium]|jgi:cytochrome c-type biogenesis protein CcsB